MVIASHVIFTAYGFWLPNDPRGSWSDFVGAWELFRFGRASRTTDRRSLAALPHCQRARQQAKSALKYPPVVFNGTQARALGRGFANLVQKLDLNVFACSVLPEHVHMVIGRHELKVEKIVQRLKGAATREIDSEGMHPMAAFPLVKGRRPKTWARGLWKVFLDTPKTSSGRLPMLRKTRRRKESGDNPGALSNRLPGNTLFSREPSKDPRTSVEQGSLDASSPDGRAKQSTSAE